MPPKPRIKPKNNNQKDPKKKPQSLKKTGCREEFEIFKTYDSPCSTRSYINNKCQYPCLIEKRCNGLGR